MSKRQFDGTVKSATFKFQPAKNSTTADHSSSDEEQPNKVKQTLHKRSYNQGNSKIGNFESENKRKKLR